MRNKSPGGLLSLQKGTLRRVSGQTLLAHNLMDPPFRPWGEDRARTNAVAGHVVLEILKRDGTRQAEQGGLGRHVIHAVHRAAHAVHGCHIENTAEVARAHMGQSQPDGMKRGRDVDRQRSIPVLDRKINDRRKMADDRIVHQNVDRAEAFKTRFNEVFDAAKFADIRLTIPNADAGAFLQLGPPALDRRWRFEAVQHDAASSHRQPFGDRKAQAASGSGQNCNAAL
jgi:hypothetical protein